MIILIGECAVDETVFVKATRLCPEAPVPVVVPVKTEYNQGMAGNVYSNIMSLGGVTSSYIATYFSTPFHHKKRFVDSTSGYILLRVDKDVETNVFCPSACISFIEENKTKIEAIVVSDYGKGFLNDNTIAPIASVAKKYNIPMFLDTKLILGDWSKDIFCVKINGKEYANNLKYYDCPSNFCQNLIVTLGGNGASWWRHDEAFYRRFHAQNVQVLDVCGAGDTMLAALVLGYVRYKSMETAIKAALQIASYAVTKRGVYCVTQDDLEELGFNRDVFSPLK